MVRSALSAARLADRFLKLSLLGLVSSGSLALVGSGAVGMKAALWTAAGLLVAILLITLTERGYAYVKLIAFLELLAAAILSTDLTFFLFLALFLLFGVAAFTSSEVRRATYGPHQVARSGLHGFYVRLAALSLAIAAGILSLTAGFFFLLPRTADAAFQRLASSRYRLPGFSNELRLGEIGEVLRRETPLMHVRIRDAVWPPGLKWHGALLSRFDGTRWSGSSSGGSFLPVQDGRLILETDDQRRRAGTRITYEVRLKYIGSDGLFFAGIPEVLWIDSPAVLRTAAGAYELDLGTTDGLRYGALSFLGGGTASPGGAPRLAPDRSANYLQLPALDPRVAALALRVTDGAVSSAARAQAVEAYLRKNYAYTLELPSQRPADPVAWFLFDRRKGHCEYFASAMAVMLRTLGIPSRLVTGFQGGVLNPVSGWRLIRASDAHSWVEAWLPDRGWTEFDPTPPAGARRPSSLWTKAYWYLDTADMFWQDWVVNYDIQRQLTLAVRMGDSSRGFRTLWLDRVRLAGLEWKSRSIRWVRDYGVMGLALAALLVAGWLGLPRLWRLWKARQRVRRVLSGQAEASDATLLYARMLELLRLRGFEKPAWLTPGEFAGLITEPAVAPVVRDLTGAYNELRYGGNPAAATRFAALLVKLEKTT